MEYRRRVPRQPAAWSGFCHIDGETPGMWRDCEVVDVSMFGLGVTFIHPQPWELVHRRILVDISAIGDAVNIRPRAKSGMPRSLSRATSGSGSSSSDPLRRSWPSPPFSAGSTVRKRGTPARALPTEGSCAELTGEFGPTVGSRATRTSRRTATSSRRRSRG